MRCDLVPIDNPHSFPRCLQIQRVFLYASLVRSSNLNTESSKVALFHTASTYSVCGDLLEIEDELVTGVAKWQIDCVLGFTLSFLVCSIIAHSLKP